MQKVVVVVPHSHTWFWTQTCVASLVRNPPKAPGCRVTVAIVDNSPWSPALRGVTQLIPVMNLMERLALQVGDVQVVPNFKSNKFHASALDCVVERFDCDYLMALETDVMALRPTWLEWFLGQMRPTDYAVGHWHHERFVNPSCTLYRGSVLREMLAWCRAEAPQDELRWGEKFSQSTLLDCNLPARLAGMDTDQRIAELARVTHDIKSWVSGPFAEKRGWPDGTVLVEAPSGQLKGPGWYEPGQQLHAWAVDRGHTYTVCETMTTVRADGLPLQTVYGSTMPDPLRQLEAVELFGNAETAHLWGGTRALDVLKHPVTCEFVKNNTPMWLAREARFWLGTVPQDIRDWTLELVRKFGWHTRGQGSDTVTDRDREAAAYVRECYRGGGVEW